MRRPRPGGVANTAIQIRRTAGRRCRRPVFCSEWPHSVREVARGLTLHDSRRSLRALALAATAANPDPLDCCAEVPSIREFLRSTRAMHSSSDGWSISDGYRSMQRESVEPSAKPPKARHQSAIAYAPRTISTARLQAFALSFAPEPNQDDSSRRLARTAACLALVGRWWSTHSVTAL